MPSYETLVSQADYEQDIRRQLQRLAIPAGICAGLLFGFSSFFIFSGVQNPVYSPAISAPVGGLCFALLFAFLFPRGFGTRYANSMLTITTERPHWEILRPLAFWSTTVSLAAASVVVFPVSRVFYISAAAGCVSWRAGELAPPIAQSKFLRLPISASRSSMRLRGRSPSAFSGYRTLSPK
jgi:hypothetical protein